MEETSDKRKLAALIPCGHTVCEDCAPEMIGRPCPICRKNCPNFVVVEGIYEWNLDSVFFVPTLSYPRHSIPANYSDSIAGLNLFSAKMKHNALRLKWIKLYQKLGLPLLFVVIFLGLSCYLYLNSLSSLTFWKFLTYFESSFPYISTVNFWNCVILLESRKIKFVQKNQESLLRSWNTGSHTPYVTYGIYKAYPCNLDRH